MITPSSVKIRSDAHSEPLGAIGHVIYGTKTHATRSLQNVRKKHKPVNGTITARTSERYAGQPYDAKEGYAKVWILGSLAWSVVEVYSDVVQPLTDANKEALWQDFRTVGKLFHGEEKLPPTWSDFEAFWHKKVALGEEAGDGDYALGIGETGKELVHALHNTKLTRTCIDELATLNYVPDRWHGVMGSTKVPMRGASTKALLWFTRRVVPEVFPRTSWLTGAYLRALLRYRHDDPRFDDLDRSSWHLARWNRPIQDEPLKEDL